MLESVRFYSTILKHFIIKKTHIRNMIGAKSLEYYKDGECANVEKFLSLVKEGVQEIEECVDDYTLVAKSK